MTSFPSGPAGAGHGPANPDFAAVHAWLQQRQRFLVLAHERPDGDAYGALCGCCGALTAWGKDCVAYLKSPPPERYRQLPRPRHLAVGLPPDLTGIEGIICLDVSRGERTERPEGLPPRFYDTQAVCVLDHHADNDRFGTVNCIVPEMAATCQLLFRICVAFGIPVEPATATALLAGVIMDTGGFRYANTDAAVLADAARLVTAGADCPALMEALFLQEPFNRRQLAARLLEHAVFAADRRLVYAVLEPEWLAELQVPANDTEGLIDTLRGISGVDIACLIQPEANTVRLSWRARSLRYPVDALARELGGGGHPLAAGVKLPRMTVADAMAVVLKAGEKVLAR